MEFVDLDIAEGDLFAAWAAFPDVPENAIRRYLAALKRNGKDPDKRIGYLRRCMSSFGRTGRADGKSATPAAGSAAPAVPPVKSGMTLEEQLALERRL